MVEERPGQPSPKNVQHYVELGRKILVETKITGDVSQDNFIKGFPPCSVQRSPLSLVESFIVLLCQLSDAIKNQLKAPQAPYYGLWDEMPTWGLAWLFVASP